MKDGTLRYSYGDVEPVPITGSTFVLPAANVTVTAEFEEKNPEQLIDVGTKALAEGNFDAAINAFESSWQQNKTNREAIVYSSLGALASIARDQNVRNLVRDRLGFTNYPGTIGKLITADWMETYTEESLVWGYYENDTWHTWHNPEDEWDASFFKRNELTPKAGYYAGEYLDQDKYILIKASAEKITGPIEWYFDETLNTTVFWYDYDPNNYDGSGTPGYYYWNSDSYDLVSGTQRTDLLDYYYDEDFDAEGYWRDSAPDNGTGWTVPGYYFSTSWAYVLASETPRYDRWTERLPGLSLPSWFADSSVYKDSLTSAGTLQASQWPLLLFANLVEKNQNGLNSLLDDILSSVFGSAFEDAAGRSKDLAYDQVIELDAELVEAFGLTDLLEGDRIYVGRAELDLLFSALRLFKASLEWVAAYDWNTDISFLKTDWNTLEDGISTLSPVNLPFGNNFLKDRNNGSMARSKTDFVKALETAVAVYDHLAGDTSELPAAYVDELNRQGWIKDGLSKLKDAIQNGGNFYVSEPSGDSYDNTAGNAVIGINMGKLFTPNQFAIDQLINTESDGKAPQFYAFGEGDPQPVTSKAQMNALDDGSYIGFQIKFGRIREVIVKGLPDEFDSTVELPMFPAQIGKDLYGLYHK